MSESPSATMTRPTVTPEPPEPEARPAKARPSLLRLIGTVSGITLMSRVLGLIRDVLMAAAFGLGPIADAFYVAWTIPNLFRRLCGEGALSSAFLPVYSELKEARGPEAARRLAGATTTRLGVILLLLVALAELGVAGARALGWTGGLEAEVLALSQLLLPYLWFICLAGLLFGVLQSEGDFARPAFTAVILNLVWIAALLIAPQIVGDEGGQIRLLAAALVFGGALQLGLQLWGCERLGQGIRPRWESSPELSKVGRLYAPIAFGMAVEQLNILADRGIAYACIEDSGGVSALYYAMRLVQLPTALIGMALATVLFPAFLRRVAAGEDLSQAVRDALGVALFATVPAAVGLGTLAPDIVALLFERGEFGPGESARTAACLLCYGASVVFISGVAALLRGYHAQQRTREPVKVGVVAVLINLVLNLLLVRVWEERGLALATTCSAAFSFFALYAGFGGLRWRDLALALARSLGLSALMAGACLGTLALLGGEPGSLLRVALPILVAVALYAGLSLALRIPEARALLRRGR